MGNRIVFFTIAALVSIGAHRTQAVTTQTTASGNWTNAAIWSVQVPTANDSVLVKFGHTITVDTASNQVGNLRLDAGTAAINLNPGGSLEIVNSGSYPTNGAVSFKAATSGNGFNVQGGDLTCGGQFEFGAGGTGVENFINVTGGTVDLQSYASIGLIGSGTAKLNIEGNAASVRVGGNLVLGTNAVLRWQVAEDGTVAPLVSDNSKDVTLAGSLVVDLSPMTNTPAEIVLIDKNGATAMIGSFTNITILGSASYDVSYTGGDGNDLSLVYSSSEGPGDLLAGWTRATTTNFAWPSIKNPNIAGFKAKLLYTDNSGTANKYDRGSSDLSFGSLFAGLADEAAVHSSTSTFAVKEGDLLELAITNNIGIGHEIRINYVLADFTPPFNTSPNTLTITYVRGDLGIPANTVIGALTMPKTSGLTGFNDYPDLDASLLAYSAAQRTLTNGQYAVFALSAAGGAGASYIDNIGISGVYTQALSGFDLWASDYPTLTGGQLGDDDNDGLINLYEYGLGGDPTNAASIGHVPSYGTLASGGTNYFEYVHARRTTPGNGLAYYLEQNNDLVFGTWTNSGDYVEVGIGTLDSDFESVTNWIPTTGKSKEFVRLIIQ